MSIVQGIMSWTNKPLLERKQLVQNKPGIYADVCLYERINIFLCFSIALFFTWYPSSTQVTLEGTSKFAI